MKIKKDLSESVIFPIGNKVSKNFTGDVWVQMLVMDKVFVPVYNVTFGPGARTDWHSHPGGQILLVTGGEGFYKEEGKPTQPLHPSDVVKIPPNTKHWHGASENSWFVHVGITIKPELGDAEWIGPVTDEEYDELEN